MDCSEALGLWNAVEHMVMDYCVNTGIQIQLDRKTVAGLWRTWKVVFPSFLKVVICSLRLKKFTLSGGESKAETKEKPDVTHSAVFIHKSALHAVDITL